MSKKLTIIGAILAPILLIGLWFVSINNSLVTSEEKVDAQWANVESKLQRRYDLIPNLVNSVQGSMKQEEKIFGDIAEARKQYASASTTDEKVKATEELDQSVGTMISVINENYPELKSNENVKTLMTQLEGTENRISVERDRYNEIATKYNTKIRKFPTSIIANMSGFEKRELFKAVEGADKAPEVSFE